ncbi:hypothetical protein EK21DRAFT_109343 [Setomelanomma holmii]|uniref:Uncharacterized protein n=1 Tax=Setomelanomma holmii TaxID=210430 RepID=A0A9P4LQG5_9PLEO|nr:hypothetical protein EK21DRAFT_109343 [Setomelanomma holmii]
MAANPSQRVAAIPELLEQVLLFVDQRALLTSCFRHLFFQHTPLPQLGSDVSTPEVNPLIAWGFPKWCEGSTVPLPLSGWEFYKISGLSGRDHRHPNPYSEIFRALPWAGNPAAWNHEPTSWRRMHTTNPAITVLHARLSMENPDEIREYTGTSKIEKDLRIGDLYDYMYQANDAFHFASNEED